MANDNPNTGRGQLNENLKRAAANFAGPAMDLASGASAMQAAGNVLKGAVLDKLLGPTALLAGGLVGVLRTIKAIVSESGILERGLKRIASIQQIQGKFETLLKSAEKAQARLKDLYKFTASAPFDFQDVAEANRILQALTKGALAGSQGMKLVGDSAAATGISMTEAADRIGKLYAALKSGRSLDKIMFQLQMSGAATDDLAAKLEQAVQSGADFSKQWAIVEDHLRATEGGMQNEMKTLGALSTRLANASRMMEQAFGEPFVESQVKAIENTVKATEALTPLVGRIGSDLAPILKIFTEVKNEIVDATIATKGFASALGVAYTVAKSFAVAIAGTALASLAGNFLKIAGASRTFVTNLAASRQAVTSQAGAVAELAKSQTLAKQAGHAFAEGSLLSAGALAAQAGWTRASAAVLNVHRTAMATTVATTGKFSLFTYAAAAASQVLAGGLLFVKNAALNAARGLAAMAMAHPIVAAAAAALAAGVAFKTWAEGVAKTNQEYIDLVSNLGKVRGEMRKQVSEVKTLDDWRKAMADVNAELAKTREQMLALDVKDENFAGKLREFGKTRSALNAERDKLEKRRSSLGLGADERQAIIENAEKRSALSDTREQAAMDRADDYARRGMLAQRIARLTKEADIGEENARGRTAPERYRSNPTDLMRINSQIAAYEKIGHAAPAYMYEGRARLVKWSEGYHEKRAQVEQDKTELQRLNETLRLKELELTHDKEIARLRSKGAETATAEAAKTLALLQEQLKIAKEKSFSRISMNPLTSSCQFAGGGAP